ncbi:MAG: LPS export ABC transporter permease LptG [Deltaproteobacteria bacterium]|nr:LPS export ABC transporter permease LptG [Deltaproteobacteria bacterium]
MNILAKYVLREFTKILALTLVFFIFIYLFVDFFEKIHNFLEARVAWTRVFYFFLMALPSVIYYLSPVAILVAILISMGIMARNGEIIALKAAGVSLFRLSMPILIAAVFLSVLTFVLADRIIPQTVSQVNEIWANEVQKHEESGTHIKHDLWLRGAEDILNFKTYNEKLKTVQGVVYYSFDQKYRLVSRLEASSGRWVEGRWELENGFVKTLAADGTIAVRRFERELFDLPKLPSQFGRLERATEEMSSHELAGWIESMAAEGYDPIRYEVDLQFKYSFPFICVIMALIGLPIAFWKERGSGIALGVGLGIGLSFCYLVFLGLSRSLGYSGLLPPVMVAWLPNLIFSLLGLYLFACVKQ